MPNRPEAKYDDEDTQAMIPCTVEDEPAATDRPLASGKIYVHYDASLSKIGRDAHGDIISAQIDEISEIPSVVQGSGDRLKDLHRKWTQRYFEHGLPPGLLSQRFVFDAETAPIPFDTISQRSPQPKKTLHTKTCPVPPSPDKTPLFYRKATPQKSATARFSFDALVFMFVVGVVIGAALVIALLMAVLR